VEIIKSAGVEDVLKTLGRPFVQKVFCVLAAFNKMSARELEKKTSLSARTVYDALTLLERAGLIERKERGVYAVASNRSAKLFGEAYHHLLVAGLAEELTRIMRAAESIEADNEDERRTLLDELETLAKDYGDIIEREFPRAIQEIFLSLSGK